MYITYSLIIYFSFYFFFKNNAVNIVNQEATRYDTEVCGKKTVLGKEGVQNS